jgi:pyruvate kinase
VIKRKFAKTKILTTLGPATDSEEKLLRLVEAGADGFRLNFSHGSYEYFDKLLGVIEKVRDSAGIAVSVLVDLQGPKIRVGELSEPEILISSGEKIVITVDDVTGTKERISCSYKNLAKDSEPGNIILIDDGLLKLKVVEKDERNITCEIIEGGILKPRKGINLPGMKLNVPPLTEKDKEDLEFVMKYKIDFIALSFVRSADDINYLKSWLAGRGYSKPIIAKIEKPEAVEDFEDILAASDGIMVARGDLGVEMEPQEVPVIQKNIIRMCRTEGKLVITATQMLESMIHSPRPTRAEASDIANAVWDGTDVVMLSAETSVGSYPVESVKIMNDILSRSERENQHNLPIDYKIPESTVENLFDSSGKAVVDAAERIRANLLVVFTDKGRRAKIVSKFRPVMPAVVFSNNTDTLNELNLYFGVMPLKLDDFDLSESSIGKVVDFLREKSLTEKNDIIIFTAGVPHNETDRSTWTRPVIVD